MNSEKSREAFEAWVLHRAESTPAGAYQDLLSRYDEPPRDYRQSWVYSAWEGWKACRDEISVANSETVLALIAENKILRIACGASDDVVAQAEALCKDAERYRRMRAATLNQINDTQDQFDIDFDFQLGEVIRNQSKS
jgi:hypothetical protein